MNINDRQGMKAAADNALFQAPNQKKLVLLWTSISIAFPLLVSVCNFMLNTQIAETGGLSGIGLRSILSTIQSALSTATSFLIPFWTLGYTATVLRFSRNEPADSTTLLEGFRRFGPALRAMILKTIICTAAGFAAVYAGIILLSLTPLVRPVYQILEQNQSTLMSGTLDESMMEAMIPAMMPITLICCVLCFVVLLPILYRLRLTDFCLLDADNRSALFAIHESRRLMRRNCLNLFKLDLSFWWYYLAQILLTVLCYGDVILPVLGVTLPFHADVAFFVFYIAAMLAQLALFYLYSNKVQTTYAIFYDTLRNPRELENSLTI